MLIIPLKDGSNESGLKAKANLWGRDQGAAPPEAIVTEVDCGMNQKWREVKVVAEFSVRTYIRT